MGLGGEGRGKGKCGVEGREREQGGVNKLSFNFSKHLGRAG